MSECWVCEMGWPVFWTNASAGMSQAICSRHQAMQPEKPATCQWCSNVGHDTYHAGPCPRIKSLEYRLDGSLKRVEFHDCTAKAKEAA